jgi:hypothetical protein
MGTGAAGSGVAESTTMATGRPSASARAVPARARQPPRSTALAVKKVRVKVAMGREKSKRHSNDKIL